MARKFVDLSQEIYQGMPVFPGHIKTLVWVHDTHEETARKFKEGYSYESRGLMMSDHGPTHVDALNHIKIGGPSIDELPLEMFYGDAICLDVADVPPTQYITKERLQKALKDSTLTIRKGDIVLLDTGHYRRNYGTSAWLYEYAGLDWDAATWLADQGVVSIGADAPSIDCSFDPSFPAHRVCRDRNMLNIENMANLEKVAGQRFIFSGTPLKIRGGTGSPIRAIAIFES